MTVVWNGGRSSVCTLLMLGAMNSMLYHADSMSFSQPFKQASLAVDVYFWHFKQIHHFFQEICVVSHGIIYFDLIGSTDGKMGIIFFGYILDVATTFYYIN